MIDIHSHLIYNVDDGSVDEDMTLEMLKIAVKEQITNIIATPHYILGANKYNSDQLKQQYEKVCNLIKTNNLPLELLLGNEIYIDLKLEEKLSKGECNTLGDSKYVLFELPMQDIPQYTSYVIYQMLAKGYKPIMAHPERYSKIQSSPNKLIEWIENGCLMQVNSGSITGLFGERIQETVKNLITHDMVHFVATDAHTNRNRGPYMQKAYHYVKEWVGEEKANDLFINNPKAILNDSEIAIKSPIKVEIQKKKKRSFLKKILSNFS